MKQFVIPIIFTLALTLSACSGGASTPTPTPTVSLDAASPGEASTGAITASAVVVPVQVANLSFPAVGRVQSVDVKVGDKVTAGQPLIHLDTALLEASVRVAEANLAAAEIQVSYLIRVGTDERFLESARADVDRTQALLDSAKATLIAQSALLAPMDGTVVTIEVNTGETVVPGQAIVVLGDLSKYQIETTDLSERDVTRVKVGQTVKVSIMALGQEFTGKVIEIALVSTTLGGDVVYSVTIEFDKQPQGLMWGMSADVEIQAE
jgi:multidrug efflux pump subunit AcrA (membrane-fusion protein)